MSGIRYAVSGDTDGPVNDDSKHCLQDSTPVESAQQSRSTHPVRSVRRQPDSIP